MSIRMTDTNGRLKKRIPLSLFSVFLLLSASLSDGRRRRSQTNTLDTLSHREARSDFVFVAWICCKTTSPPPPTPRLLMLVKIKR